MQARRTAGLPPRERGRLSLAVNDPQRPSGFGGMVPPPAFQRPSRPGADPPVKPDLMAYMRRWAKGKTWRRDGAPKTLPWVAIELTDADTGTVLHPIDDLSETSDPEAIATEVWTRMKVSARGRGDGLPHHFLIKCHFADTEGRQTHESWEDSLTLPIEGPTWGTGPNAAMGRFGGATFLARRDIQEASRERDRIESQQLGLAMMNMAGTIIMERTREDADKLRRHEDRELQIMDIFRSLMEDKRAQEREDRWESQKMKMLEMLVGRLSHLAAPLGMSVTKWLGHKLGMIQPRTPREEKSFATLRRLVECARSKIREKALAAGQAMGLSLAQASEQSKTIADDPNALMNALAEMGVDEDDPVIDDLTDLLMEMQIEASSERNARRAASLLTADEPKTSVETPAPTPEKDDP